MMLALSGAAERPRATLMTALPLVWGEGDAEDILQGRSAKSETLTILQETVDVRVIDVISRQTLGRDVAIIAQPRRLLPTELVALDAWVRAGGRAMIFADPELVWPSRFPQGDNRRAPPVELLDPLFTYWGIALGDSDRAAQTISLDGQSVRMMASGAWTGPKTCKAVAMQILDCRIGKGRVLLVGDADMLDPRLWQPARADNPEWIADRIRMLGGAQTRPQSLAAAFAIGSLALAFAGIGLFVWRQRREQT